MATTTDAPQGDAENAQPFLTVTRGNPTPEELAALTAVVSALAAGQPQETASPARHSERFWHRRAEFTGFLAQILLGPAHTISTS